MTCALRGRPCHGLWWLGSGHMATDPKTGEKYFVSDIDGECKLCVEMAITPFPIEFDNTRTGCERTFEKYGKQRLQQKTP